MKRFMAIDPGEKRIGLALSDLTGTLARPLEILQHHSRSVDAAQVAQIAAENDVGRIIIGLALDSSGETGPQARKALRFADALREQTKIPIIMWDESGSTQIAQQRQIQLNLGRKKKKATLDSMAAVVILQSYLEHISSDMHTDLESDEKQ